MPTYIALVLLNLALLLFMRQAHGVELSDRTPLGRSLAAPAVTHATCVYREVSRGAEIVHAPMEVLVGPRGQHRWSIIDSSNVTGAVNAIVEPDRQLYYFEDQRYVRDIHYKTGLATFRSWVNPSADLTADILAAPITSYLLITINPHDIVRLVKAGVLSPTTRSRIDGIKTTVYQFHRRPSVNEESDFEMVVTISTDGLVLRKDFISKRRGLINSFSCSRVRQLRGSYESLFNIEPPKGAIYDRLTVEQVDRRDDVADDHDWAGVVPRLPSEVSFAPIRSVLVERTISDGSFPKQWMRIDLLSTSVDDGANGERVIIMRAPYQQKRPLIPMPDWTAAVNSMENSGTPVPAQEMLVLENYRRWQMYIESPADVKRSESDNLRYGVGRPTWIRQYSTWINEITHTRTLIRIDARNEESASKIRTAIESMRSPADQADSGSRGKASSWPQ